jgi:hypothetical protein
MHLAYSALRDLDKPAAQKKPEITEIQLRHRAYVDTCKKYSHHIAEIQKYFPHWLPGFSKQ